MLKKNIPLSKALAVLNKKTCLPNPLDYVNKIYSSKNNNNNSKSLFKTTSENWLAK